MTRSMALLVALLFAGATARVVIRGGAGAVLAPPATGVVDQEDAAVAAARLAVAKAEALLARSGGGAATPPRFAEHGEAVAVVSAQSGEARAVDPVSAVTLALKSVAFVMDKASDYYEGQTALMTEASDR